MFHFYLGDPVEMLQLKPDGTGEVFCWARTSHAGMRLQHNVPGGVWQGSRLKQGGKYALLGTTMSPGFEYDDYETGKRQELIVQLSAACRTDHRSDSLKPLRDDILVVSNGGDTVSTEAVAARRHAGPHLPVIGWNNTTGNSQLALAA